MPATHTPDFSGLLPGLDRVAKHLWMGATPDPGHLSGFDMLVLCAKEIQPRGAYPGVTVVHVPLDDSGVPPTEIEVQGALIAAREVAAALRRGERVLVACHMGMNRSGLVTALALRVLGATPASAIGMVRDARGPNALSNRWFEELVRTISRAALAGR